MCRPARVPAWVLVQTCIVGVTSAHSFQCKQSQFTAQNLSLSLFNQTKSALADHKRSWVDIAMNMQIASIGMRGAAANTCTRTHAIGFIGLFTRAVPIYSY